MKNKLFVPVASIGILAPVLAYTQTSPLGNPGFSDGKTITAEQLAAEFALKQDYNGTVSGASVQAGSVNNTLATWMSYLIGTPNPNKVVYADPSNPLSTNTFFPVTATVGDYWTQTNSLALGGAYSGGPGSLTIRGYPYGYYDLGTLLSVVNCGVPLTSCRAGINGGWEAGVSAIAGYGSFDTVNIYNGITPPIPAIVVSSGVTYDATHVYFSTPLTASQIAQLRKNMYVLTNSIDGTVSTTPAITGGLPHINLYGSYITSWATNGTSITVVGWTVPGSGHTAAGQVPSSTYDTTRGYSQATVMLGIATNVFSGNDVIQSPSGGPSSYTNSYQWKEVDMPDYSTSGINAWRGLSLSYVPYGGNTPSADSYMAFLSGGGTMPVGLKIRLQSLRLNTPGQLVDIDSDSLLVYSDPEPGSTAGSTSINSEWLNFMDSNDARLQLWTKRDITGGGWNTMSLHLGLQIDGSIGSLNGTQEGQIVWDKQGYIGGLSLLGSSGNGLNLDSSGNSFFTSGASFASHLYSTQSTAPTVSSCGATAATVVSGSTDMRGIIAINTNGITACTLNASLSFSGSSLGQMTCVANANNSASLIYISAANATTTIFNMSPAMNAGTFIHYHCW